MVVRLEIESLYWAFVFAVTVVGIFFGGFVVLAVFAPAGSQGFAIRRDIQNCPAFCAWMAGTRTDLRTEETLHLRAGHPKATPIVFRWRHRSDCRPLFSLTFPIAFIICIVRRFE